VKIAHVGPDEIFHRYLTPKWAFLPTSGAGAAIDGGRFNRPGVEALYLSQAPQTALEEYKQGASISPPATLVAYKITLAEVTDLSRYFVSVAASCRRNESGDLSSQSCRRRCGRSP
jgi:RES domain-containing protein